MAAGEMVEVCRYSEVGENIDSFMDWLFDRVRRNEQWTELLHKRRRGGSKPFLDVVERFDRYVRASGKYEFQCARAPRLLSS